MNSVAAEQLDVARRGVVSEARGTEPAPARRAFGFQLDESTAADVKAWAAKSGVDCQHDKLWLIKYEPLSSMKLSLKYSDYLAEVTAMNMPPSGVLVREHYLSARD